MICGRQRADTHTRQSAFPTKTVMLLNSFEEGKHHVASSQHSQVGLTDVMMSNKMSGALFNRYKFAKQWAGMTRGPKSPINNNTEV